MIISTRYAPAVTILLAFALIPTIRSSYVGAQAHDGRSTGKIPIMLAGQFGSDTQRGTAWAKKTLSADDAIERRYGSNVTLFVGRSYDAKQLYHHPELGVAYGRSYSASGTRPASERPEVVLHWLTGQEAWALYALAYEDTFVSDPIRFELRRALTNLVRPREPMTLFFVHGRGQAPPEGEAVLLAAIDSFRSQQNVAGR
jgi:hypothetical protein